MKVSVPRRLRQRTPGAPLATADWLESPEEAAGSAFQFAPGKGIWLGRSLHDDEAVYAVDDRHALVTAANRSGKGAAIITPTLATYRGSVAIIDPKGEAATITARFRAEKLGQKVVILDPFGVCGASPYSLSYNPLVALIDAGENAVELAEGIADAIIVRNPSGEHDYWDDNAKALIVAIILLVCFSPALRPEQRNLPMVQRILDGIEAPGDGAELGLEALLIELRAGCGPEAARDAMLGASERFVAMSAEERGSCVTFARRHLAFLSAPRMRHHMSLESRFRPMDLKTDARGQSLYLVLPRNRMHSHARWLRLMIKCCMEDWQSHDAHPAAGLPILNIIDELPVLGSMREIEESAGFIAGYGVRFLFVIQDLSQIQARFPKSWQTFIGNCGTLIAFANTDLETTKYLSERIGDTQIEIRQASSTTSEMVATHMPSALARTSASEGVASNTKTQQTSAAESVSIVKTPLVLPNEIARMFRREEERVLIIQAGENPLILKRADYFRDAALRRILEL